MAKFVQREGLPSRLQEVYVDFHWSQRKLWELEIHYVDVDIHHLDWILDYPVWYMDPFSVPRQIMENPELDQHHWNRVLNAELNYPIHAINWKGRMLILDGIHRLIKAKLEMRPTIKTKVIDANQIHAIFPDEIDFLTGFLKGKRP